MFKLLLPSVFYHLQMVLILTNTHKILFLFIEEYHYAKHAIKDQTSLHHNYFFRLKDSLETSFLSLACPSHSQSPQLVLLMAGAAGQALKQLDKQEEMKDFLTSLAHKLPHCQASFTTE